MTRIGILSDTHAFWDDRYASYFAECDEIWHAGDIGSSEILDRLGAICPTVRAVRGNIDYGEVKRGLPELLEFKIDGVSVIMTHIGGYPGRWSPGMRSLLLKVKPDIMVSGHSHILKVIYDRELKLLHINPGAAGRQGWQKVRTLVRLTIDRGRIKDCEVIELH